MADLKHPHIVTYHESFFDENQKHLCIIQVSNVYISKQDPVQENTMFSNITIFRNLGV